MAPPRPTPAPHSPSPSPRSETPIPDSSAGTTELPLSMSASVVLSSLPRDAHLALEQAGAMEMKKGEIDHLSSEKSMPCLFFPAASFLWRSTPR